MVVADVELAEEVRKAMPKKEAKRRKRDEEDIALGGTGAGLAGGAGAGAGRRGKRGVGLEDEFADVLRGVGRGVSRNGRSGDGYEGLRERGRVGVHAPIAVDAFVGGRHCAWGLTACVRGVGVDDGGVWVVHEETVAFADDSAKEGKSFLDIVGCRRGGLRSRGLAGKGGDVPSYRSAARAKSSLRFSQSS